MKKSIKSSAAVHSPRAGSKIDRLIDLLKTGSGRSLEDMTDATGWQAHTVRAAMTGLRKRGYQIDRANNASGGVSTSKCCSMAAEAQAKPAQPRKTKLSLHFSRQRLWVNWP